METRDRTSLARRVGHMTYEQVHPLFEEVKKQRDERRGDCPDCKYMWSPNWWYCDVHDAMKQEVLADMSTFDTRVQEFYAQVKACPNCHDRGYKELELACEKCSDLGYLFHLYTHRLQRIETNKQHKRFEQAHGRKLVNVLELVQWLDEAEERTS